MAGCQGLTFSPIQRMVPTSSMAKGERMRSIDSTLAVADPGFNAEVPLNTVTLTSSPFRTAAPTSTLLSTGSPMRIASGLPRGTKRTRPFAKGVSQTI